MIGYTHIKKLISAFMLVAFSLPVSLTSVAADSALYNSSTILAGNVKLTDSNSKITLSLRDSDVKQVLRMFADKAGKNIVFHNSVAGKVTLDLVDMPINDAFNLVLQVTGLNYYNQGNTMIIIAKDNEDNAAYSKQEMMTFPVNYTSAAKIADFLNKNVFSMKKAGLSGVDAATVNSATNELIVFGMPSDAEIVKKVIEQFDKEPLSKTYKVNHTTPAEMADMICNMLLPSNGSTNGASGGGRKKTGMTNGSKFASLKGVMTGAAAGTSSSSAIKLGEGVVACTVSTVSEGTNVPFDVQNLAISYFTQRGTVMAVGGSLAQQNMIEKFIKENDTKQPQAYLEMQIVELNEDGSKEFNNTWSYYSRYWTFTSSDGTTSIGRQSYPSNVARGPMIELKKPSADRTSTQSEWWAAGDLYRHGSHLSWSMNYIIENGKGRVLASPKVIITNGQESKIDLTQDYVEKVTSEFLSSGGLSADVVQRTYSISDDKGIKITLTPFISPDGYVTMNIKPEYATEIAEVRTPSVVDKDGNVKATDLQATLLSHRNLELKNVRVKDGETFVIGGMIQEGETKTVKKIPVLGDLPVVGVAFRSSSTSKVKNELVIMITPHIIKDSEDVVSDNV